MNIFDQFRVAAVGIGIRLLAAGLLIMPMVSNAAGKNPNPTSPFSSGRVVSKQPIQITGSVNSAVSPMGSMDRMRLLEYPTGFATGTTPESSGNCDLVANQASWGKDDLPVFTMTQGESYPSDAQYCIVGEVIYNKGKASESRRIDSTCLFAVMPVLPDDPLIEGSPHKIKDFLRTSNAPTGPNGYSTNARIDSKYFPFKAGKNELAAAPSEFPSLNNYFVRAFSPGFGLFGDPKSLNTILSMDYARWVLVFTSTGNLSCASKKVETNFLRSDKCRAPTGVCTAPWCTADFQNSHPTFGCGVTPAEAACFPKLEGVPDGTFAFECFFKEDKGVGEGTGLTGKGCGPVGTVPVPPVDGKFCECNYDWNSTKDEYGLPLETYYFCRPLTTDDKCGKSCSTGPIKDDCSCP